MLFLHYQIQGRSDYQIIVVYLQLFACHYSVFVCLYITTVNRHKLSALIYTLVKLTKHGLNFHIELGLINHQKHNFGSNY